MGRLADEDALPARELSLVVMGAGNAFAQPLPASGEITLGRGEDCDVVVDDPKVSRRHLSLRVDRGGIAVIDQGSRNGSFMGESQLRPDEPVALAIGDVVRFGSTILLVERRKVSTERARLHGRPSFDQRVANARAQGTKVMVLQVVLRVAVGGSSPATWGESDPGMKALVTRFDQVLDDVCDDDTVIAETGPVDRCLMVVARSGGWPISEDSIRRSMRDAGVDANIHVLSVDALTDVSSERRGVVEAPHATSSGEGAMAKLRAMIDRVAGSHINVLLLGETGVGKEVMASMIHARSSRAKAPLVCLNCAALTEALLESELFGHEKGAFTGATHDKPGLLEAANGGVVFLDEVGEMPLSMQAKLLRVLEKREVLRVGSLRPRPIDVRFVAATNRDLEAESRTGHFRQDLYFRLSGVTLTIPPLRERVAEIGPLATQFAREARLASGRAAPLCIADETMAALNAYTWPGNVRELRNVMERAVLFCEGDTLLPEHLALPRPAMMTLPELPSEELEESDDERRRVLAALEACAGNQTHAARMLGIARGTLIARLAKYNVPRPRKR